MINKKALFVSVVISINLFANTNIEQNKQNNSVIQQFDSLIKEKKTKKTDLYSVDLDNYKILDLQKETINYYYNFIDDLYGLGNLIAAQRDYLNIRAITKTNLIDEENGKFVIDMNYPYYYFTSNLFWLEQGLGELSFNDLEILDLKPNLYALKIRYYPYFIQNLYLILRNLYALKINEQMNKYKKLLKIYRPILFRAGIEEFINKMTNPAYTGTLSDTELFYLRYYLSAISILKKELFVKASNVRIVNSRYSTIHSVFRETYKQFQDSLTKSKYKNKNDKYNFKINNKVFNFIVDYDYILYLDYYNKTKEVISLIGKFFKKYRDILGDSHFLNAKMFFISGLNFLKAKKYDKAIKAFELSKKFYQKFYPFYKDIFIIQANLYIADTLRLQGKFSESIQYYDYIIKEIEKKLKNKNLDIFVRNIYNRFLIQTYINVGNYYYDLGNQIMDKELKKKNKDFDNLIPISIAEQLKYKRKALEIFKKALKIRKEIIKKEKDAFYNIDEDPYIIMIKNNIDFIQADIELIENSF